MASCQDQCFIPWAILHAFLPSYTPIMHHSSFLPDIQTSFLQSFLHSINPPLLWPTYSVTTSTLPYIDPLSNPVLHSLYLAEPSENTFINIFVHTLCYSFIVTLSILLIPSKPLRLSICTSLIQNLSSLHICVCGFGLEIRGVR